MCEKFYFIGVFIIGITILSPNRVSAEAGYPDWTLSMKIWPFDILYPFKTGFARINGEDKTTDSEIRSKLETAKNNGANVVIFYIDDEQSYETFVDDMGFSQTFERIQFLVNEAHHRGLKVFCYLNGLEMITVGARKDRTMASLARNYPDWLQIDIKGDTMMWYTTHQTSWIPKDSEDAWASPLSPWRDFYKGRLEELGSTGVDGVYIDATFLPGVDDFGIKRVCMDLIS